MLSARAGLAETLVSALNGNDDVAPAGQHDSKSFWSSFVTEAETSSSGVHSRGLFGSHKESTGAADLNRQIDWLHYDPTQGLLYASAADASELLEYPADTDMTASVNVGGFRMANEDQQTFEKLQSAQLRIDVLQRKSLLNLLSRSPDNTDFSLGACGAASASAEHSRGSIGRVIGAHPKMRPQDQISCVGWPPLPLQKNELRAERGPHCCQHAVLARLARFVKEVVLHDGEH